MTLVKDPSLAFDYHRHADRKSLLALLAALQAHKKPLSSVYA